jgi:His-Xaa-Ser system protein HxsD
VSQEVAGFPSELAAVDVHAASVRIELDESLYPLDAIYGAAYIFIDRCFVLLDKPAAGRVRATLALKNAAAGAGVDTAAALRALVGEFANELVSCAWRHQITRENRALIESVTAQAVAGAMGPPSLDELAKFDFTGEALEDPLGIAMSWEEKYKKKQEEKKEGAK